MEELGNYLKNLREKQGLSLEEMASDTKISIHNLAALEENRWEEIPSKVYQKLFLKAYLEQLGVEPNEISQKLKEIKLSEESEYSPLTFIKKRSSLDYILIVSGIILLLIILWTLFKKSPKENDQPQVNQAKFSSTLAEKFPSGSASKEVLAKNGKLILRLEASGKSWIEIVADGDTVFKGHLNRNQKKEWSSQNNFIINIGNPKVVTGFINDQKLKPYAKLPKRDNYWEIKLENYQFLLEEKREP